MEANCYQFLLAGTSWGTEYFVATTGTDDGSNDGRGWAAPLLTISNGVAKTTTAGPGSIVTVSNGTYNISTQINVSAAITVRSFGNGVTGGMINSETGCQVLNATTSFAASKDQGKD